MGPSKKTTVPVTAGWVPWRESVLVPQERAAVMAALDSGSPEERAQLRQVLGFPMLTVAR